MMSVKILVKHRNASDPTLQIRYKPWLTSAQLGHSPGRPVTRCARKCNKESDIFKTLPIEKWPEDGRGDNEISFPPEIGTLSVKLIIESLNIFANQTACQFYILEDRLPKFRLTQCVQIQVYSIVLNLIDLILSVKALVGAFNSSSSRIAGKIWLTGLEDGRKYSLNLGCVLLGAGDCVTAAISSAGQIIGNTTAFCVR